MQKLLPFIRKTIKTLEITYCKWKTLQVDLKLKIFFLDITLKIIYIGISIRKRIDMETITIPKEEYTRLRKENELLKDNQFLKKVDELLTLLLLDKYQLILTDYTDDLAEYSLNSIEDWDVKESGWDHV